MKKRYWLGIVISALFVYLMFRSVELTSVARAFSEAEFVFLVPAITLYFVGVFVRTWRWAVLLSPVRQIRVGRLFVVMVSGFMANDLLPLRAGEAVRAFMLWRKEGLEPGATVGTIVVERILDGLTLTGFLLLAGLLIPLDDWVTRLAWAAGAVFALGVLLVVVVTLIPGPFLAVARRVLSPLPFGLRSLGLRLLETFVDGLGILRRGWDTLAVVALSVAAWGLEATMYYLLMFSFPFAPSFVASMLGAGVANLGSMVPSSPGYVGTFDLPLSAVLVGSFRVDPSLAAGYTLLVHAALILPVVLLGLFFVWREGLSFGRIASAKPLVEQEGFLDGQDQRGRDGLRGSGDRSLLCRPGEQRHLH